MFDHQGLAGPNSSMQVAGWERFGWLRHGFSTRFGGVSTAYCAGKMDCAELNLGWTAEDDPALVAENRRRFIRLFSEHADMKLVTVRQEHGAVTQAVLAGDGALEGRLETVQRKAVLKGDGLITGVPGVLLGIQTADCVPVLVADTEARVVGAFHAGWRGTVARIVEHGIAAMEEEFGSKPENLVAAVGPSIGPCCYQVGDEVKGEFHATFAYAGELFRTLDKEIWLDLWEANRRQLLAAGVKMEGISMLGECSGSAVDEAGRRKYFSHRMDKGVTGRMMSVVGVV